MEILKRITRKSLLVLSLCNFFLFGFTPEKELFPSGKEVEPVKSKSDLVKSAGNARKFEYTPLANYASSFDTQKRCVRFVSLSPDGQFKQGTADFQLKGANFHVEPAVEIREFDSDVYNGVLTAEEITHESALDPKPSIGDFLASLIQVFTGGLEFFKPRPVIPDPVVPNTASQNPPPGGLSRNNQFFFIPEWNYEQDNESACAFSTAQPGHQCCNSPESCAVKLVNDHISPLDKLSNGKGTVRLITGFLNIESPSDGHPPYLYVDAFKLHGEWGPREIVRLDQPENLKAYVSAIKDLILLLGAKQIYTTLLVANNTLLTFYGDPAYDQMRELHLSYLRYLAHELKDIPYLIGFDIYNEPGYHQSANFGNEVNKHWIHELTQSWYDAIREEAPHALVTIGNVTGSGQMWQWDPSVMKMDFNSAHTYPPTLNSQLIPNWEDYLKREIQIMEKVSCGPGGQSCETGRKPSVLGEFGYATSARNNGGVPRSTFWGNKEDQKNALLKMYGITKSCHFQGLWWWTFADENPGNMAMGLFSHYQNSDFADILFANYSGQQLVSNVNYYFNGLLTNKDELFARPAALSMRDDVNYLNPAASIISSCWGDHRLTPDPNPNYHLENAQTIYKGVVTNPQGEPLPYAQVTFWDRCWENASQVFTDENGHFEIYSHFAISAFAVSAFRYYRSAYIYNTFQNPNDSCTALVETPDAGGGWSAVTWDDQGRRIKKRIHELKLLPVAPGDIALFNPPSAQDEPACVSVPVLRSESDGTAPEASRF